SNSPLKLGPRDCGESLRTNAEALGDLTFVVRSMNSQFKENRQITHNSIFADFALPHSEFRPKRNPEPNCQRSIAFFSVHGKARPVIHCLTKIASTLSPEELQLHALSWTAYRGTDKIYEYRIWSIKIYRFLANLTTVIRVNSYSFVVSIFVCLRGHRFVIKDQAAAGHAGFSFLVAQTSRSSVRETLALPAVQAFWEKTRE